MNTNTQPKSSKVSEADWKHPQSPCLGSDWLTVIDDPPISEPHHIYWAEYGNPCGEPVMFVHGGPGGGCTNEPKVSRFFDPQRYRIILFDQRGCGKSKPTAAANDPKPALTNNETKYLIEDINQLRKALRIRGKMHVFGGSWGSTLALAYAIKHPDTVQTLVLRGIFLCRKNDLDYFYQGNAGTDQPGKYDPSLPGSYMFFPEAWKLFVETIPDMTARGDMIGAYAAIFEGTDEKRREDAAKAWSIWEGSTSYLHQDMSEIGKYSDPDFAKVFARIENHYFLNGGFLEERVRNQNYIVNNVNKIKDIPIHIVQGRYDQVCPMYQAEELVAALKKAGAVFINYVVTAAGHSSLERANCHALSEIMDILPLMSFADARIEELCAAMRRVEERLALMEHRLSDL
jgi:proline iminopeptidase